MAWCISDQEKTLVIELLFKRIQEMAPQVEVTVLMTDDGN